MSPFPSAIQPRINARDDTLFLARQAFSQGMFEQAIDLLSAYIALPVSLPADGHMLSAYELMGDCYLAKGDYAHASAWFKQALYADAGTVPAILPARCLQKLALCWQRSGDIAQSKWLRDRLNEMRTAGNHLHTR